MFPLGSPLLALVLAAQLGQIQVPRPVGFVNDFANVITPQTATRLDRIIQNVRTKSGGEIVVVTLPDLGGRDPADVAREIGRQWKVGAQGGPGDRARNAGVIILLVPKETSRDGRGYIRIETGRGAEGFLTDATTGAIQDEALPELRNSQYSPALELITTRIAQRYANEFQF
ncbi:MAG TPA: TPM domain-containing protein, partial [Gemmatimonadaceae bacterium]|nr:TPM domain-containing protein [Gemmatimonadaceae bacterium]